MFVCFLFRTDEERKHFTGALCGLGPTVQSQDGLLPDNDIELTFDVRIDTDDISEVSLNSTPLSLPLSLSHTHLHTHSPSLSFFSSHLSLTLIFVINRQGLYISKMTRIILSTKLFVPVM